MRPISLLAILLQSAAVGATPAAVTTAPSAADVPRPAEPAITEVWQVPAGANLSAVLSSWAERAGWTLVWEPDTDFRLTAAGELRGDFTVVATHLIEAFRHTSPRLRAAIYDGNHVIRVWADRSEP